MPSSPRRRPSTGRRAPPFPGALPFSVPRLGHLPGNLEVVHRTVHVFGFQADAHAFIGILNGQAVAAGQVGPGGGVDCRIALVVPILPDVAGEDALQDLQTGMVRRALAAVCAPWSEEAGIPAVRCARLGVKVVEVEGCRRCLASGWRGRSR